MRWLIALALAACTDGDPHEIVACKDATPPNPAGTCEAACASQSSSNGSTSVCVVAVTSGDYTHGQSIQGHTFEFDGVSGQCHPQGGNLVFIECE